MQKTCKLNKKQIQYQEKIENITKGKKDKKFRRGSKELRENIFKNQN